MKKITTSLCLVLAALALVAAGCKKKEETGGSGSGSAAASGSAAPVDPQPAVDYLKLVADHTDEAKGKVEIVFSKWSVVKASFDPANLEGGTAELEVDPSALSSGVTKRDDHLRSPDYLDVAKFPKATVKIANVKKAGERAYTADATVNIHGVEKTWALSFEVTASTADSVQVKFTQPFSRVDFGVGKPEEDSAKPEVELHGLLTIKQT